MKSSNRKLIKKRSGKMIHHCGTVEINTERLKLRAFRIEDAEDIYHGWTSDESVAKYTSWYAHSSIEETKGYIGYILAQDKHTSYNWIIEHSGKAIGSINVCSADDYLGIVGIAYALSYESWGKGYITEASKAVAKFLFELGYRKIIAGCDAENVGSKRVLEKIGMKQEACLRNQILRKDGTYADVLQFGLFKEELVDEMK